MSLLLCGISTPADWLEMSETVDIVNDFWCCLLDGVWDEHCIAVIEQSRASLPLQTLKATKTQTDYLVILLSKLTDHQPNEETVKGCPCQQILVMAAERG